MIMEVGQRYRSTRGAGSSILLWQFHGRSPVDGKWIMEYIGRDNTHGIYMYDEAYMIRTYGTFEAVPYDTKPVV